MKTKHTQKIMKAITEKQRQLVNWNRFTVYDRLIDYDFYGVPKQHRHSYKIKNSFNTILGKLNSPYTEFDHELPRFPSYEEIDALDRLYHAYISEGYCSGLGLIEYIYQGKGYKESSARAHILSMDNVCIGFYIESIGQYDGNPIKELNFFYLIPGFRGMGIFKKILDNQLRKNALVWIESPSKQMETALAMLGHDGVFIKSPYHEQLSHN